MTMHRREHCKSTIRPVSQPAGTKAMNAPNTCSIALLAIAALVCADASAAQLNGQLPMYPHGHNMNAMPASAVAAGVPMVLETTDSVSAVDAWYAANASKACMRTAQSGSMKYACPSGSIMIYAHDGKTQIAFVPAMPHFQ